MMANIDTGFVELLNKRTGLNLSWLEFKTIYQERKAERDADPIVQRRREWNRGIREMEEKLMEQEIQQMAAAAAASTAKPGKSKRKSSATK